MALASFEAETFSRGYFMSKISKLAIALPILAFLAQPAAADIITGNFQVKITGDNGADSLSKETGGGSRSNFTESLSNQNHTLTGSFSENLSSGSSYGYVEFFDINLGRDDDPYLSISFSNLFDGTSAEVACTNNCIYNTTFDNHGWAPGAVTATFANGNTLLINLQDDDEDHDIPGKIKLTFKDPPTAVPEPMSLSLFGAGLIGAAASRMRRRKKA